MTVDVLLPVYNVSSYLDISVMSLLRQSFQVSKIILVDDFSTDETLKLALDLAASHPQLNVLTSESNRGIVHQLNRAIELSDADLIIRMDGDDICAPQRIAQQVAFMKKNPTYVACSGSYRKISESGKDMGTVSPANVTSDPYSLPAHQHFLLHPFLAIRRQALIDVGGYKQIAHCEDADLYYRLLAIGKLHNLPDRLGDYRIHTKSVSSKSKATHLLQCLNSQLCALNYRRSLEQKIPYNYKEKEASRIQKFITGKSNSIPEIIRYCQKVFSLTPSESDWLNKAFTIKYLKSSYTRNLPLTPAEISHLGLIAIKLSLSFKKKEYVASNLMFQNFAFKEYKHLPSLTNKWLFMHLWSHHRVALLCYKVWKLCTNSK